MPKALIGRWGRSLAVRIPGRVASAAGICEGAQVELEERNGDVVIRRAVPQFTLAELFRGKSAAAWRREYADAYDWGPDVGHEIVEE
jgi:antitoxin component of MazEF toxin-antitoxin module